MLLIRLEGAIVIRISSLKRVAGSKMTSRHDPVIQALTRKPLRGQQLSDELTQGDHLYHSLSMDYVVIKLLP